MVKFLKPNKAVVLLQGRYASSKVVIVRAFDDGTRDRPYGHCLVVEINKYPSKVIRKDSTKKTAKKSRVKAFVKLGFSYDEIPELCNTLPVLELCYSMSQKFMDEQQKLPENAKAATTDSFSSVASPIANWRISSPCDHPEDVKARLKFWVQAVACTIKLCNYRS